MNDTVHVPLGSRAYDVEIGPGLGRYGDSHGAALLRPFLGRGTGSPQADLVMVGGDDDLARQG